MILWRPTSNASPPNPIRNLAHHPAASQSGTDGLGRGVEELMIKPLCLDLFCKAGGTSRGYQQAGFYVAGVDIEPQKNYIGDDFLQADALEVLRILIGGGCIIGQSGRVYYLADFDLIAASPPCQAYVGFEPTQTGKSYPELIDPTRELLKAAGKPYVIENVPGAPLLNPLQLCGSMFSLKTIRHRLFETSPPIWFPPAPCHCSMMYTASSRGFSSFENGATAITVTGHNFKVEDAKIALGIDWMTQGELSQAIPPKYTKWLGQQMIELIKEPAQ